MGNSALIMLGKIVLTFWEGKLTPLLVPPMVLPRSATGKNRIVPETLPMLSASAQSVTYFLEKRGYTRLYTEPGTVQEIEQADEGTSGRMQRPRNSKEPIK
jgi:hypothetical protein